jgi:hypothetical protein
MEMAKTIQKFRLKNDEDFEQEFVQRERKQQRRGAKRIRQQERTNLVLASVGEDW